MKLIFNKNHKLHFPIFCSIRLMHQNSSEGGPIGGGPLPIPPELQNDAFFLRLYRRYQAINEQIQGDEASVTTIDRNFHKLFSNSLDSFIEAQKAKAALDAKAKADEFERFYSPTMTDASEIPNSNSFDDVTTISNTIVQQGALPPEPTTQTISDLQPLIVNDYWQYIQLAQIGRFFFILVLRLLLLVRVIMLCVVGGKDCKFSAFLLKQD